MLKFSKFKLMQRIWALSFVLVFCMILPPSTFTCFLPRFKVYEIRASFRPFLNEVLQFQLKENVNKICSLFGK